jgi:hypothetical protein
MIRGISDGGLHRIAEAFKDQLPGGLADGKSPEDYPQDQIEKGMKVEREHTDDPNLALEITTDHVEEDKEYYDKLKKMESGA